MTPALAFAFLILVMVAATLRTENQDLRRRIVELQAAAALQESEAERARAIVEVLTAPDTMMVSLVAGSARPVPQGTAFYHPRKGLFFCAANLPALNSGRTYQLWLVPMQGNPISAGTFVADAKGDGEVMLPPLPQGVYAEGIRRYRRTCGRSASTHRSHGLGWRGILSRECGRAVAGFR